MALEQLDLHDEVCRLVRHSIAGAQIAKEQLHYSPGC